MPINQFLLLLSLPLQMFAVHVAVSRSGIAVRTSRQLTAVGCALVPAFANVALLTALAGAGSRTSVGLFSGLVATLLAHVYFHVFNMSETARRIRLLVHLRVHGTLPSAAADYSTEKLVELRLRRLLDVGAIRPNGGGYSANPSLLLAVARAFDHYERILFPRRRDPARPARAV